LKLKTAFEALFTTKFAPSKRMFIAPVTVVVMLQLSNRRRRMFALAKKTFVRDKLHLSKNALKVAPENIITVLDVIMQS
jgi:hypothetical protein